MNNDRMEGLSGLSDHERGIVEQSQALRQIWENPLFGGMLSQVANEIQDETNQTGDDDEKVRERLFWQSKGLQRLMNAYVELIQKGDTILYQLEHAKMQPTDREEQEESIFD